MHRTRPLRRRHLILGVTTMLTVLAGSVLAGGAPAGAQTDSSRAESSAAPPEA